jgi:hypothetical protein
MANAISRMDQAGAVVAGHAVEENRLPGGIGEQISRSSHLFHRRARPAHRNQNPTHSGIGDHLGLFHVLRIVAVDRGQRHDGFDSLAGDDRPQRIGMLPSPSYYSAGNNDLRSFFGPVSPPGDNPAAHSEHRR